MSSWTEGEGNPLYVEEILRQLRETGGIRVEDGEAGLGRADVALPETIHDIIAARIDRLPEEVKHDAPGRSGGGSAGSAVPWWRAPSRPSGSGGQHLTELQAGDFFFLSAREPELDLYVQARVDPGRRLLEPSRAAPPPRTTPRWGAGSRSCGTESARRGSRAPRPPLRQERGRREGRRLRHPGRREGPTPLGEHGSPRPVRGRPQAPRDDARHGAEPRTPDRRRRQAGGDQVRA